MESVFSLPVAPVAGKDLALRDMAQETVTADNEDFDFPAAVAENIDALYRGALRMTGSREEAEDLVQEAFLRAYRFRHQFQPGTNFKAWLFKIQTNIFRSRYRKLWNSPQSLDDTEEFYLYQHLGPDTPPGDDPAAEVLDHLGVEEVRKAIEDLPPVYRAAVLLTDVEGFSYKETADILEIPVGTVMSRLHRGRQRLQKQLYEYARDSGVVS
ncbi:MAG TPA: sigma-70 family RNA polymerase sigma factor [Candidatus Dormibacteraeota bacterium]|jgi:RNA polymerase sigma-70 factor (ECF subfamily)